MDAARLAKDTRKSQKTRARILDCAMHLIAEIGYHAATNPAIADAAGLTRGAMLYHFPTREALVEAAIAHIQAERSALFRAAADGLPPGADVTEHAIDSYWDLLHSVPFMAFAELEAAGRTDPAIQALLAPAQAEFDRAQAGDHFLKILHAGAGPALPGQPRPRPLHAGRPGPLDPDLRQGRPQGAPAGGDQARHAHAEPQGRRAGFVAGVGALRTGS